MSASMPNAPAPTLTGEAARNAGWVVLGAVAGGAIVFGLGTLEGGVTSTAPATATGVAAICYLAAAVSGLRWMSWAAVPVASLLPLVGQFTPVPWWSLMVLAGVALTVIGVFRARRTTMVQAAAMVGFFGLAVLAVQLAPAVGLVLAGLVLAAHAGWDIVHYRRDRVVYRSLAVWCIGLDLTVGAICVITAIAG